MKSSLNKAILLALIVSTVSMSASAPETVAPVSTFEALSTLGSAIKTDATAFGEKTVEKANNFAAVLENCYRATRDAVISAHKSAEDTTASIGQWIKTNPNTTMAVAAVAVLGYSVYKIRQMYQTYKRGAQTATINLNVRQTK